VADCQRGVDDVERDTMPPVHQLLLAARPEWTSLALARKRRRFRRKQQKPPSPRRHEPLGSGAHAIGPPASRLRGNDAGGYDAGSNDGKCSIAGSPVMRAPSIPPDPEPVEPPVQR